MHDTARLIGEKFFKLYGRPGDHILDVGAMDINGTLRPYVPAKSIYTGIDLKPGPGVDIVIDEFAGLRHLDDTYDLIVCTSCFEHDMMFWNSFLEMVKLTKPGGFIYINAPSNGPFHNYPVDCWRFYPDAGRALEKYANSQSNVTLIESFIAEKGQDGWEDFVAIFCKPKARQHGLLSEHFLRSSYIYVAGK
jgi:SAM-dependent methyltransferase